MKRYFGLTANLNILSLGAFAENDPKLSQNLLELANQKLVNGDRLIGFIQDDDVYHLIEQGKEALNTP